MRSEEILNLINSPFAVKIHICCIFLWLDTKQKVCASQTYKAGLGNRETLPIERTFLTSFLANLELNHILALI